MQLTGRTMTDHIVVFDGNPRLTGQTRVGARRGGDGFTLFGEVVTGELRGILSSFQPAFFRGARLQRACGRRAGSSVHPADRVSRGTHMGYTTSFRGSFHCYRPERRSGWRFPEGGP